MNIILFVVFLLLVLIFGARGAALIILSLIGISGMMLYNFLH